MGIAQASVVHDDDKLNERIGFIHNNLETDAIAEQFIQGRELYVGVLGNHRLKTLPIWEMTFENLPEGVPRIATSKIKWDIAYQKEVGVMTAAAKDLPDDLSNKITRMCKRAYRILGLSGYARMDLRLTEDGQVFLLEPNPNPDLSLDEDFACAAEATGVEYNQLIHNIITLGRSFHAGWKLAEE